jgi:membrane associated rhomboid family serine protease
VDGKRVLEAAFTILLAVFLIIAAEGGRHAYGFYVVLRLTATMGAAYWAVRVYSAGLRGWLWAFLAVAVLLNPILPVRMHRADWQPIDPGLGVLLLGWPGYWLIRRSHNL